ncbi:uncharacterized protein [Rutidosis leptorrhynchoides]|uniref:uncharacterized protein n=1 Tax=Rutidosis leptorrhynchoides TaxID=125765 RepID=UPI003A9A5B76
MTPTSVTPHATLIPPPSRYLRPTHLPSLVSISTPSPLQYARFISVRCINPSPSPPASTSLNSKIPQKNHTIENFEVQITNPRVPSSTFLPRFSLSDQAFFLLTFIACTVSVSFAGFVMAAVPTLFAMSRTAIALAKLADTAQKELPSTMAAIRLSGMEISDLSLELSDLSHEISDGVNKSAQAVQTAKAGVQQISSLARDKTMSMIEERAKLPEISIQPVVAGVARKTSQAVGHASKSFMNMISGGDSSSRDESIAHIDTSDV